MSKFAENLFAPQERFSADHKCCEADVLRELTTLFGIENRQNSLLELDACTKSKVNI